MVAVDSQSLLLIAAVAFLLAVPTEYLCRRRGWGLGTRLLTWAGGAALVAILVVFGASSEEMCKEWPGNCDDLKQVYVAMLPIVAGLSLALWSVLYALAATVCISIYRRLLT